MNALLRNRLLKPFSESIAYFALQRVVYRTRLGWGVLTARWRPLPDFLIVGAAKAGTTSLFAYLIKHPDVVSPIRKEIRFFDKDFDRGSNWYKAHFPLRLKTSKPTITGDATPDYLRHPRTAQRIHRLIPNAKIIVMLRNPTERAISGYWHEVNNGKEKRPLYDAIASEEKIIREERAKKSITPGQHYEYETRYFSYISRGQYVDQVERYLQYFNKQNILFLNSKELFSDPESAMRRVYDFLSISHNTLADYRPRNVGKYDDAGDDEVRTLLTTHYRPYNERLYDLIGQDMGW